MRCAEVRPLLVPCLHGEAAPETLAEVGSHLDRCAGCAGELLAARRNADAVVPFHLVARSHRELTPAEEAVIEVHLAWCGPCREEAERIRLAGDEMLRCFSQYRLGPRFRARVLELWRPSRRTAPHLRRGGLADTIARAEEQGNVFSFERLLVRYGGCAYAEAFLASGDFPWAAAIAEEIFARGFPPFADDLTQPAFLDWIRARAAAIRARGDWLSRGEVDAAGGLEGFARSRKLRRHRLLLSLPSRLPEAQRLPFLLFHVQGTAYAEIAALLELDRSTVFCRIADAVAAGRALLEEDAAAHPPRVHSEEVSHASRP